MRRLGSIICVLLVGIANAAPKNICNDIAEGKRKYPIWVTNTCHDCNVKYLDPDSLKSIITAGRGTIHQPSMSRVTICPQLSASNFIEIYLNKKIRITGVVLEKTSTKIPQQFQFTVSFETRNGNYKNVQKEEGKQGFTKTIGHDNATNYIFLAPVFTSSLRIQPKSRATKCMKLGLLVCTNQDSKMSKRTEKNSLTKSSSSIVLKRGRSKCTVNVLRDCKVSCIWYQTGHDGCPTCECKRDSHIGLYESDILLNDRTKSQLIHLLGGGYRSGSRYKARWPKSKSGNTYTIPYIINPYLGRQAKRAISEAIEDFHRYTCIRLVKRTHENNYVEFVVGSGCWANVGMNSGVNKVSIGRGCDTKGTVIHEIMHVVGFWHEQSRPDRDEYIQIVEKNINPNDLENFQKFSSADINSYGLTYDIKSIMHYESMAFSKTGRPTLIDLAGNPLQTQSEELSPSDIEQINRMYSCPKTGNKKEKGLRCSDVRKDCKSMKIYCKMSMLRSLMRKQCAETCHLC